MSGGAVTSRDAMASRLNLHAYSHNRPFHFRIFQPVVLRAPARQLKRAEIFITVNTINSTK